MVPRCETRSSSFIPMPVSEIVSVLFGFIQIKIDARRLNALADKGLVLFVRKCQIAQLVQCVGRVGDEFAKENLRVRIERMDDKV